MLDDELRREEAGLSDRNQSFIEAYEKGSFSTRLWQLHQADYNRLFLTALFCVFVVCLLLIVVIGVSTYTSVSSDQTLANDRRLATSFIVNEVRANDELSSVASGMGPEGPSLVLTSSIEGEDYETRFYLYKRNIMQEYKQANRPYVPEEAVTVVPSNTFSFEYDDGLLTVYTDGGVSKVDLRSAAEASPQR